VGPTTCLFFLRIELHSAWLPSYTGTQTHRAKTFLQTKRTAGISWVTKPCMCSCFSGTDISTRLAWLVERPFKQAIPVYTLKSRMQTGYRMVEIFFCLHGTVCTFLVYLSFYVLLDWTPKLWRNTFPENKTLLLTLCLVSTCRNFVNRLHKLTQHQ
jgi:hypothetical protein